MKTWYALFLIMLIFSLGIVLVLGCGDDDDDDNDDNDDDDCIVCESTSECTEALGPGWVCIGGCCEQVGDDDTADDDTGDDDTGDDDTGDDDDEPGEVAFTVEDIDRSALGNRQTSVYVDADGTVHAAYTGCSDGSCEHSELFYANKADGKAEWTTTSIDDQNNDTGWFPSMAINSAGDIYILYANHTQEALRFAYKPNGGSWTTEAIGSGRGGWWTSCALIGEVLIMAHTKMPASGWDGTFLQVGSYDNDQWSWAEADGANYGGFYTAMAVTPDNRPVVTHTIVPGIAVGYLQLAEWTGTEWDVSQLDGNSIGNDIIVDDDGFFHVVYSKVDPVNSNLWDLWYATNAPDGQWTKTAIDEGADNEDDTGGYPHIAIDDHGNLHVSYRHFGNNELKYARQVNGEWEFHVADSIGGGLYSSIAIDDQGGVHVVYEDGITMHYAYCPTCAVYE